MAQASSISDQLGASPGLRARSDGFTLDSALRVVIEHLSEGLVLADAEANLLHWNPAALAMHGVTTDEEWCRQLAEFVQIFELSNLEGRVLRTDEWPLPRIIRGERVEQLELRLRRLDSDWERIFIYGGSLVKDSAGRTLAFLTITDNTIRHRAQEEIRQCNSDLERRVELRTAELQEANEELEAFSYSVSHDLRAPLRTIEGFSQVVLEDYASLLPEAGQSFLRTISQGARRMDALINDLLRFSRLSRQALHAHPVSMATLVQDALAELRPAQGERTIEMIIGELPPVWGDSSLLRQVWLNLLSNAIKYTRRQPRARIEIGGATADGEHLFFVRDNGAGFDMRYVEKLFGVFRRLHRPEDYEGTGVGLAIVQRIVRRHGGRIWVEAEPEKGASFTFAIPHGSPLASF